MGIMDKLKFWKKEKDFEPLNEPAPLPGEKPSDDLGMPGLGDRSKPPEMPPMEEPEVAPPPHLRDYQPTQPPMPQPQPPVDVHRIEIIDSKLDAIKAILSALEQRLANLERMAGHEKRSW